MSPEANNFNEVAEATKQNIEQTENPVDKAKQYQALAQKALNNFNRSLNSLVDDDSSDKLKSLASNTIAELIAKMDTSVENLNR